MRPMMSRVIGAMLTNPKYRGEKFTWDKFPDMGERRAEEWVFIHNVRGDKEAVNALAKQYAREIAERLVDRVGE
jgi:hypothetical protein